MSRYNSCHACSALCCARCRACRNAPTPYRRALLHCITGVSCRIATQKVTLSHDTNHCIMTHPQRPVHARMNARRLAVSQGLLVVSWGHVAGLLAVSWPPAACPSCSVSRYSLLYRDLTPYMGSCPFQPPFIHVFFFHLSFFFLCSSYCKTTKYIIIFFMSSI